MSVCKALNGDKCWINLLNRDVFSFYFEDRRICQSSAVTLLPGLYLEADVLHPDLVLSDLLKRLLFQSLQLQKLFVLWQISQLHRYSLLVLGAREQTNTQTHTEGDGGDD